MAVQIGLTWPTPGPNNPPPEPAHFAQIRSGGFDRLRINVDHRRDRVNVTEWITALRGEGLEPLVILDGDYDAPDAVGLAETAAWLSATFALDALEVLNEPWILHKMSVRRYATVVNAIGAALAGSGTQVVLAAEATTPICEWVPFYGRVVLDLHPRAWQVWGIHPYHNPQGPESSRAGWTRDQEHQWYVEQAHGRPIWWTETGWDISAGGNSQEEQAAYTVGELEAAVRLGVPVVCFYAMVGDSSSGASDWGFWNGQWQERPVVEAVRAWRAAHP